MERNLTVKYGNVKSYYGKARIKTDGESISLFSYDTFICKVKDGEIIQFSDNLSHYTRTTMRHLNEFLQQVGIAPFTLSE